MTGVFVGIVWWVGFIVALCFYDTLRAAFKALALKTEEPAKGGR